MGSAVAVAITVEAGERPGVTSHRRTGRCLLRGLELCSASLRL